MSWLIGSVLGGVVVLLFVPRSIFGGISSFERKLLRLFIAIRLMMPIVFEYIGNNTEQFFSSSGWDSLEYHRTGIRVYDQLSAGLNVSVHGQVPGTGSVNLITGYLYLILGGPSRMIVVYLMSLLATIGMLLFWWGTRDLIKYRRNNYSALVLLAPTLLLWNSTLGKEALISFGLGCLVASLRLILMRILGLRLLLIAVSGTASIVYVRPHVLLAFLLALGLSLVLGRSSKRIGQRPGGRVVLTGLLTIGLLLSISLSSALFGVSDSTDLLEVAYDTATRQSQGQGVSAYSADPVRSPIQVPRALSIVLLRPYVWEVRSPMQALASMESLALLAVLIGGISRVAQGRSKVDLNLLVTTFGTYILIFSAGVSTYGNFGLIARQRLHVWQFLIFLLFCAIPTVRQSRGGHLASRVASTH